MGRSLGEGKGYPLQYFGLENSTDNPTEPLSLSRIHRFMTLTEITQLKDLGLSFLYSVLSLLIFFNLSVALYILYFHLDISC